MSAPLRVLIACEFTGTAGTQALTEFFDEEPSFLVPLGMDGFIVEPYQAEDLAGHLTEQALTWSVA